MAFSSNAPTNRPPALSRGWGGMMVGTVSASIGLIQLILGIWIGGFFSVALAGGLWCGGALKRIRDNQTRGQACTIPLGLCMGQTFLFASAGMLGLLILFY